MSDQTTPEPPVDEPAPAPAPPPEPGTAEVSPTPAAAPPATAPPAAPPVARTSSGRTLGKVRSPIGCWLLTFVTLGIYGLVWYHHTNKELRDYDPSIAVNPGLAVLSLFVPIVNWVSIYNTGKRIAQAQGTAGVPPTSSGGVGVLLSLVLALFIPYYVAQANMVWEAR
jgi:hypothetical protein